MDAAGWNQRYDTIGLVWTAKPNWFLVAETNSLALGAALDLGAGEGRNAVWLAQQGWQVTAVDFSDVLFSPDDVAADLAGSGLVVGRAERVRRTAGTAVGFLTGLFGVGGGFVIVPALALVLEFPMGVAIGTSLLVIAVNTAVAFAARAGAGTIDWATTVVFTAAATAGVGAGERIADRLKPQSMQHAFAALLVTLALYTGARALLAIY